MRYGAAQDCVIDNHNARGSDRFCNTRQSYGSERQTTATSKRITSCSRKESQTMRRVRKRSSLPRRKCTRYVVGTHAHRAILTRHCTQQVVATKEAEVESLRAQINDLNSDLEQMKETLLSTQASVREKENKVKALLCSCGSRRLKPLFSLLTFMTFWMRRRKT